jgi:UDP-MurNAc hydroxylase
MSNFKITLLCHASLLIEIYGKKIITDPWFFGTAFNDGWELNPKPNLDEIRNKIQDIDIIWISHEHPDHLHFPTLKWIRENVKKDIDIYFQKTNSNKVFEALRKIGFRTFIPMQHMRKISILKNVQIACYAHRHLDSALAIFVDDKFWLLNINDTELSTNDCLIIKNNFGNPSVIYNQFSIAGSNGIESSLKNDASMVLSDMIRQHKELKAKLSVPFASFVKFSRTDNSYMNKYVNTVFDVQNKFTLTGLNLCVQMYGKMTLEWKKIDNLPLNWEDVNTTSIKEFAIKNHDDMDLHDYTTIPDTELKKIIEKKIKIWRKVTNPIIYRLMRFQPINFLIRDWGDQVWEINFYKCKFEKKKYPIKADIEINSQPLMQAFQLPFGIQTLGVSGRYKFTNIHKDVPKSWKKIRVLSSLFNAEIYLSISSLFSIKTIVWLFDRRSGLYGQFKQQLKRFRNN